MMKKMINSILRMIFMLDFIKMLVKEWKYLKNLEMVMNSIKKELELINELL